VIQARLTLANAWREAWRQPMQVVFHALAWLGLGGIMALLVVRTFRVIAPALATTVVAYRWPVAMLLVAMASIAMRQAMRAWRQRLRGGPWAALPVTRRDDLRTLRLRGGVAGAAAWVMAAGAGPGLAHHAGANGDVSMWPVLATMAVAIVGMAIVLAGRVARGRQLPREPVRTSRRWTASWLAR